VVSGHLLHVSFSCSVYDCFRVLCFFHASGFRERLLADPGFMFKVAIELGIGICTKMSAEYAKRQGTFSQVRDSRER
jgi:hypothetical protein